MSVAFAQPAEPDWTQLLRDQGYCIIPDLMPVSKVRAIERDFQERFAQTPFCEGAFYGSRTKRFGGLLKRSPHAAAFVQHPLILDIAQAMLGPYCDRIQLNLTQALEIWPGEPEQIPHRDHDMWPAPPSKTEYQINIMWPFSPYRGENGATLVWPGSNRRLDELFIAREEAVPAEMNPGSALVYLGSTMHGAGANRSSAPRSGMIVSYSLGWLKPFENQWLVYPPEIARTFSPELAALAGYQLHRPNLGNYEGQCPSVLLGEDVPDYLPSIDGVREDQAELIEEFKARQLAGSVIG